MGEVDIIELLEKSSITNKTKINFLVIGAPRAGSTWLTDMLSQHPSIYISKIKEFHYFNAWHPSIPGLANSNRTKSSEWYLSFFRSADEKQLKGEGTTTYLWDPDAAQNIFEFDPEIKLIAILRNPVHRTFSSYLYGLSNGVFTKMGFSEFVKQRPDMLTRGLYYQNLQR